MATTAQALTVDPDQQAILKELAARELRSPEFLLHEAIGQYLLRRLSQERTDSADNPWDDYNGPTYTEEELDAEAQASLEHYDRTGLHLTQSEVTAWAEKLKTDRSAPMPECHV